MAVRVNGEPLDERSLDRAIEFAEQRSGFRLTLPAAFSELGLVLLRVDVRETREGRQVELLFDNWPPDPRAQMTTAILVTTPGGLLPEDWAVLDLGLEDVQARWIDDQPSPGSAPQIRIWSARANQQVSLIVLGPNRPALDGAAAMLRSWLEANP
ncbi:MAG TPA: hypothetical protein VFK32_03340 [Tepidiformaceae bacterium]|nr:hypothetical protein [Tepidiformaceae bacterium]